jgi:uncharacterized membrane protein
MGLLELFGKKEVPSGGALFSLQCDLHPYRLPAHKAEFAELEIKLENVFDKELLTSLVISVPKNIGFDQTGLQTEKEIRLGMLQSKELKHMTIKLWAAPRTPPATYSVKVFALSHYRDYGYVLGEVKKTVDLRVV